jgi:hypothetical protein
MDQELLRIAQESIDLILDRPDNEIKTYLDPAFPSQGAFVADTSRFLTAQCSRRAGKTNGLALRFFYTLAKHPGALCLYIALTRESARNIMWPVLQEQDALLKIGCEFTESNLTMTHPNGARLQLFGADMKNFIRRLKGIKTPGAAIDEAQDFGVHIQSLVDDVLTPTLTDYEDSWLAVVGTPGPIPFGYFFDITQNKKYGFSFHAWTCFENPYLPNARGFVDQLKKRYEWDDSNPTYLREWKNQWVLDLESLLIRYEEAKSHYVELPPAKWNYIMGIDIGFEDADAIAVIAWSDSSPNTYLVEEVITNKQGLTELVSQIRSLGLKYDISKMVIDEGGLGKKLAEEIRRQHHIPVQAADKSRKMETVEFLNDQLRMGKFKARSNSRFASDSKMVQIDWEKTTPDSIKVKNGFHSDVIDAVLYAFKESPAFSYSAPPKKPKKGTKEWEMAEVSQMEQEALDYFTKQESPDTIW